MGILLTYTPCMPPFLDISEMLAVVNIFQNKFLIIFEVEMKKTTDVFQNTLLYLQILRNFPLLFIYYRICYQFSYIKLFSSLLGKISVVVVANLVAN